MFNFGCGFIAGAIIGQLVILLPCRSMLKSTIQMLKRADEDGADWWKG